MRHHQWQRVRVRGARVQEVDRQPVDLGLKLADRVQLGLDAPPVITIAPVLTQILKIGQRNALRPIPHRLALWPTRPRQALAQVLQLSLSHIKAKRSDLSRHHAEVLQHASAQHQRTAEVPVLQLTRRSRNARKACSRSRPHLGESDRPKRPAPTCFQMTAVRWPTQPRSLRCKPASDSRWEQLWVIPDECG